MRSVVRLIMLFFYLESYFISQDFSGKFFPIILFCPAFICFMSFHSVCEGVKGVYSIFYMALDSLILKTVHVVLYSLMNC